MRDNYNSFSYWEKVINENKTIRGHMFMEKPPTKNSIYFHTLVFSKKNGLNNVWGYFPNLRTLIGYIQYSFLQEAFYKWIYGKDTVITKIPHETLKEIVDKGLRNKKIDKETASKMFNDYENLSKLWDMPDKKAQLELRKFVTKFNKDWMGDNQEFLYIKLFNTAEELGDFVITSHSITSSPDEIKNMIGREIEDWKEICKKAVEDECIGAIFKDILLKKLSKVF